MNITELDTLLENNQLSGFWRTRVPGHASEAPFLWKWEPLLDGLLKASETIGIEQAERRAIRLVNPHLPGKTTSHSLQVTFSIVNPGEVARAHRHNMAAIRFVVQGKGAYTAVDGEKIQSPNDLFLTLEKYRVGDSVNITLLRDGKSIQTKITLEALEQ